VPGYGPEPERNAGRRPGVLAVTFVILVLTISYLPATAQQRIAWTMRVTILRPFLATQERLAAARMNARDVEELMAQVDSMTAVLSTQAALSDENHVLRELLNLSERAGPTFLPATVLRAGMAGSESMFLVAVGSAQGVYEGAPVVTRNGLVGVIREVQKEISRGMDWTHPDFTASAMLEDGTMFGFVDNRRGTFREVDRLVLDGTAFNEEALPGTRVLTSGLGGVYPRGIPVGVVAEVEATQGQWRKSYWLRPMVEPGQVTHVLIATRGAGDYIADLWLADSVSTSGSVPTPTSIQTSDSVQATEAQAPGGQRR
jgi:rod shape-determining protein MreC